MWEFLTAILEQYGVLAVMQVLELGAIIYLFKLINKKDDESKELQEKILSLSEKRLQDLKEERENYEELSENLDKSIKLLIEVFKKQNGS